MEQPNEGGISRRSSLITIGGVVGTVLTGGALKARAASGPEAVARGAVSCVLTPELIEGPYYIAGEKVRRNITDGRPGTPLSLHLKVLDASTCKPIEHAAVDIWHADASGEYSGLNGSHSRFMRGIQRTNSKGVALFHTVYPGWYTGRTVHIHVKLHVRGSVVHTGQLFFRDSLTDRVYKHSPYSKRPNRDVRNSEDAIYRNGGSKSVLAVHRHGKGYVGSLAMGVHAS